LLMIG